MSMLNNVLAQRRKSNQGENKRGGWHRRLRPDHAQQCAPDDPRYPHQFEPFSFFIFRSSLFPFAVDLGCAY